MRLSSALLILLVGFTSRSALAAPPEPVAPPTPLPVRPPGAVPNRASPEGGARQAPGTPAAPAAPLAPEACRTVIERTATLFETVTQPLIAEAQKRENANADAGQRAFEEVLTANIAAVAAARAESRALEATLSPDDKKACEDHAYRRFMRSHARFAPAAGFFAGRITVFRSLGSAFAR